MNVKVIKSEKEYDQALERLDIVFDAPPDTPDGTDEYEKERSGDNSGL